ncbi:hypothetical protein DYB25_005232 [Aphanomyces astaci]|uniref:Uncharacterized protein n=1 Tax=Aphanomyces astaci TaxID=112090 RepID=A0A397E141_APHAT|nr:hypothetical protein DYB25_005232 [Aphanomyces astaci]RHY33374.1 hypothetical protein DYB34_001805 [Aphanomyces astaci]RHY74604.1 hypothetical protein DYB30_000033 [Aphanomyces astaci]RHZ05281.1 hypothetical protein DYB26_002882 [Aphanomyces astaci]RHZ39988.1 hypothetical protein DYB31_002460 [Aphanomyces astaci]
MKLTVLAVLAAVFTLECHASSFREPRHLMAAECDKDCSPEQGLSWTLCKLGQAGSCTWQGVSSAGAYVYHGAASLVGAHSDEEPTKVDKPVNGTNTTAVAETIVKDDKKPKDDDKKPKDDDKKPKDDDKKPKDDDKKPKDDDKKPKDDDKKPKDDDRHPKDDDKKPKDDDKEDKKPKDDEDKKPKDDKDDKRAHDDKEPSH